MGYGDYTPSSSGRAKPLTKKQVEQAKKAFLQADAIAKAVKESEKNETNDAINTLKGLDAIS